MTDMPVDTKIGFNTFIETHPNRACPEIIKMTEGLVQKCTDCPLEKCFHETRIGGKFWRDNIVYGFKKGVEFTKVNGNGNGNKRYFHNRD